MSTTAGLTLEATALASMPAVGATVAGVRWLNYLRVPVVVSGLLLLVWSPLILRVSNGAYHAASGLSAQPFAPRWLAITAVLFAISAVTLVVRAMQSVKP